MKRVVAIVLVMVSTNVLADYGYSHQSDSYSHELAEQQHEYYF